MTERIENMGRRVEIRRKRLMTVAECESLRAALRKALPVAEDVETLDGDAIVNLAIALSEKLEGLKGLDRKLAILKAELGD